MTSQIIKAHQRMVGLLSKPGQDIIDSLTPAKAHLWHMGFGLLGEAAELLAPIATYEMAEARRVGKASPRPVLDRKNVAEELGDGSFFARAIYDDRGITRVRVTDVTIIVDDMLVSAIQYVLACGKVADVVKKYVVYNKAWNDEYQAMMVAALADYERAHAEICLYIDKVDDDILRENMEKLLTGERARYKDAVYSDMAAQTRADKEPGE